ACCREGVDALVRRTDTRRRRGYVMAVNEVSEVSGQRVRRAAKRRALVSEVNEVSGRLSAVPRRSLHAQPRPQSVDCGEAGAKRDARGTADRRPLTSLTTLTGTAQLLDSSGVRSRALGQLHIADTVIDRHRTSVRKLLKGKTWR